MGPEDVRALALLLPEVVEGAHSGHPDFRIGGRVFLTLWVEEERAVVKLPPALQAAWVEAEPDRFAPVPGSWGARGWTSLDLVAFDEEGDEEGLRAALLAAWTHVAPPGLAARYEPA